jgi:hypothetical protein
MTSTEKSTEAKRRLLIANFEPGKAIKFLVKSLPRHLMFTRPWMLAQLLAWAILDQEPGKRRPKSTSTNTSAVQRRPGKRRYAHYVGNYALALLLDRKLSGKIREHDKMLMAMLRLFSARGGGPCLRDG